MRTAKYIVHRFRAAAMQSAGGCMSLVRRLYAALSCSRQRDAVADVQTVRLYIQPHISGRLDRQAVSEHIRLLHWLKLPVQVYPLQKQIPTEAIGIEEWWCGERREYRAYLRIRVERVVKKSVECLPIPE